MSENGSATDLSRRALSLEVSPTVAVAQRAAALRAKGEAVLDFSVGEPDQPTFSEALRLAGSRPILVHTQEKDGFQVTASLVSKATSPRTKAVILNSPGNPTGAVIDPEDLLVIGDMAQRRKFTLLYDDTYARLTFGRDGGDVLQDLRDAVGDRLVVLGTASKSYCMTGWRIGWMLGPKPLIDACAALISHSTQCPAAFAQAGAIEALTGPQKFVQELCAEYRRRRDFIHAAVPNLPKVSCVSPGGGFYLFPNLARYRGSAVPTTMELSRRLLEEQRVAVVPGEAFAAPGYIRISFARPMEDLREGVNRVAAFLESLREG